MKKVVWKVLKISPFILIAVGVFLVFYSVINGQNGQSWFESSSHHENLWEVRMDFWGLQSQSPNHEISGEDQKKINARKDQVVAKATRDLYEQGRWFIVISVSWDHNQHKSPDPFVFLL